jgi:hypothetical protein
MTLINSNYVFIDTIITHKNLYEKILPLKKESVKKILIIASQTTVINNYFENAEIDYIDVLGRVPLHLVNKNTKIYNDNNNGSTFENLVNDIFDKNTKYDIILDDGIHTENTIEFYMTYYTKWLTNNGIIIIEDACDWIQQLTSNTPDELKPFIEIYNVLDNKNNLDDTVFIINKNNLN